MIHSTYYKLNNERQAIERAKTMRKGALSHAKTTTLIEIKPAVSNAAYQKTAVNQTGEEHSPSTKGE